VWILKATGFNRGIGIHVFNRLEDLSKILREYHELQDSNNIHIGDQMYKCSHSINRYIDELQRRK